MLQISARVFAEDEIMELITVQALDGQALLYLHFQTESCFFIKK